MLSFKPTSEFQILYQRMLLNLPPNTVRTGNNVQNRFYLIFTALHGMQTRYSDEKAVYMSVRLSVCLSDKRVECEKKICPNSYTRRKTI